MKPIIINTDLFVITSIIITTTYFYKTFKLKTIIESNEHTLNEFIKLYDNQITELTQSNNITSCDLLRLTTLVKTIATKLPIKGEPWQMDIFAEKFDIVNKQFNGPHNSDDDSDDTNEFDEYGDKHM